MYRTVSTTVGICGIRSIGVAMDEEVMAFLEKHENKSGRVGEFIRSCILVAERAANMDRETLKNSAQMGYLIDCFISPEEQEGE